MGVAVIFTGAIPPPEIMAVGVVVVEEVTTGCCAKGSFRCRTGLLGGIGGGAPRAVPVAATAGGFLGGCGGADTWKVTLPPWVVV